MYRDVKRLSEETFDLVIVGGGILGGFLAHESARRGVQTALIERNDFASGTTSASGKVLHGGLRYLQHLEPGLAAESSREQSRISSLAPGLVRPLAFVVPARTGRPREAAMLRGGAWTWRVARKVFPGDGRLPPPRFLRRSALEDVLGRPTVEGFSGAMRFHDWQIRSPERLTVALVCDAREHGAAVANYVEAVDVRTSRGRVQGVSAADGRNGRRFDVRGRIVVNAAGPWGAHLAASVDGSLSDTGWAKGMHVVVDLPEPPAAVALPLTGEAAGSALGTERRIFLMPWEGRTLVGATYSPYNGDLDDVRPEPDRVGRFLDGLHREWPQFGLDGAKPLFAYAGLYPIFGGRSAEGETFEASLRPRIVNHGNNGGPSGLISAISVKLTGAWRLAEEVLEIVEKELDRSGAASVLPSNRSLRRATPTPLALDDRDVAPQGRDWNRDDVGRMVDIAVTEEMAVTVSDFIFRRTWLGHLGRPDPDLLAFISRRMGRRLGWDEPERAAQIERAVAGYRGVPDDGSDHTPETSEHQPGV